MTGRGRLRGKLLALAGGVTIALLLVLGAWAYWTAGGTGIAAASVGTLAPPTAVSGSSTPGTTSVALTWSAPAAPGGGALDGYYVLRSAGGPQSAACGSSPSSLLSGSATGCTDAGLAAGTYAYVVVAVFRTWTATSAASGGVTVVPDPTPPTVVSIDRASSSPTTATSVSWIVTFSETVTGVGTADFALAAVGPTGASITGVTGSGTAYTITASTGSGDGTLGLNLVDDDSIIDTAGNPLGGTGASNGSFTGQTYTIDKSPPAVSLALSGATGSTYVTGTTAYTNPQAGRSGSFGVTATATDSGSGVQSVTFPSATGFSAGGATDTTSPYQTTYTWSGAGATASGSHTVTATNTVALSASATFTITPDTTAPTVTAPTVTAGYVTTASIPVTLPAATDAGSGVNTGSVTLQRDQSTLGANSCAAFPGTWATTVTLSSGNDTTVASGSCYRYRQVVSDNVGNQATSAVSSTVKVDTSGPSAPTLTLSAASGNTYMTGTTAYINPQAGKSGGFTVAATTSDAESGIQSVTFPSATGFTAGGATDTTSPYQSTYTWSGAAATASGSQTVTAANNAALTATSAFTITPDTTAPTITVPGVSAGYVTSLSVPVTVTAPSDGGSGVASTTLQRDQATLSAGACAAFPDTWGTTVTLSGGNDTTVVSGRCYRYRQVATDNVGNQATSAASSTVQVDTSGPSAPTLTLSGASGNTYVTGTTAYTNPQAGKSGSFTVAATTSDSQSAIQSVTFPSATGFTAGGVTDTTSPYQTTYTWSGAGATASGAQVVTSTNGAGLTATASFTITPDTANPTGGALTVNGVAATTGGSSSTNSLGSFTIGTRIDWTDSGSGLSSSVLTRAYGATCATASSPTTLSGAPAQSGLAPGCYVYVLTGTDRVGNVVTLTTSVTVTATLAIGGAHDGGGSSKVFLTGTGVVGGGTVTVVVCPSSSFPCGSPAATLTASVAADGTWTTGSSTNIGAGPFWARATQGALTSSVFGSFAPPYPA